MSLAVGTFLWLVLFVLTGVFVLGRRRLRAMVWRGRLPGRLGALPVEDVEAHEAPRGWKCAQLLLSPDGGQVRLAGVSIGGSYLADDRAACVRSRPHRPPALSCECGFYAFLDRDRAVDLLARRSGYDGDIIVRALCEAEFSGTVVEHEHGYRAERQQILGIALLPWCADCAVAGRLEHARWLGSDGRPALSLGDWGPAAAVLRERLHPSVRLLQEWSPLRPYCDTCAEPVRLFGELLSLGDVASRVGTEIRWLASGEVSEERVLASHRPRPRSPR